MELRDPIRSVLKHKGGNVWTVPPSASVYDAIAMMGEKQVGALLVMEDARRWRTLLRCPATTGPSSKIWTRT
jgi:CBS domain-containing protein